MLGMREAWLRLVTFAGEKQILRPKTGLRMTRTSYDRHSDPAERERNLLFGPAKQSILSPYG